MKNILSRRQIIGSGVTILSASAVSRIYAAPSPAASDFMSFFEFRNAFRTDSEESIAAPYAPIAWNENDKRVVKGRIGLLAERARGLLELGAIDGPISLYRIEMNGVSQAKGQYRRLAINGSAFPRTGYDWLTRIIAHELVHIADPYNFVAFDPEFTSLIEPRIQATRALLGKNGLTTIEAAAMPLGERRSKLEAQIRTTAELPSAYAAESIEEALAEIVSFMLDRNSGFRTSPAFTNFLNKRLLTPGAAAKIPAAERYREGIRLANSGKYSDAVAAYSEALVSAPAFMMAFFERSNAYLKLNARANAIQDLTKALDLTPPSSRWRGFLANSRSTVMAK
jgi:tetratricopeptide (TPR) repeat protein